MQSRRNERNQRYGRFIGLTALGSLIPGTGLIAAGKRRLGTTVLVILGAIFVLGLAVVILVPPTELASYGGDRQMMLILGTALAAGAVAWLLIALGSHRSLEPDGLPTGKRLAGALVVVVSASVVVAPMAVGSRYAFTQRELVGNISSSGSSNTTPEVDLADPWADKPRLNVLFLGGDAGEGRTGLRPDTQILASIDTESGATTMISLPRNLQGFPFPEGTPLADAYPDGFTGGGDPLEWMLNAVYANVPRDHPEVFEGVGDPGADATKWAVEGALGVDVDYFVMVDLAGFEAVVDALGGITVNVPRDIPWGNKSLPDGTCTEANGYIQQGDNQHLDGFQALWFARSRCGSDDYERMERQRCVMNAIVDKVDPATLLSQYQSLASAAGDIITSDVPADLFPALIELMGKVRSQPLESLTLDNEFFGSMGTTSSDPDYDLLHTRIQEILADTPDSPATPDAGETTPPEDTTEATGQSADDASDDRSGAAVQQASGDAETQTDESTEETPGGDATDEPAADEPVDAGAVC
ncbi:LytR family transcriptional regulator [Jiangella aurantiaca]|uniref:LytR family transcriptional regulator n=1 Tax=Jiangella aurantiaca TaxID=2530373 RepID=A0A4R5AI04_9ACTN|nr:LCP family protein [Jiangella aurantiaca]TDD72348.1 LytR family transcriptional regulator [Jiangella aurantiaca]